MFESVPHAPPDPILGLSEAFKRDTNPQKINLSVGVYQDENGQTPILESVKRAEIRLLHDEDSKSYLGIEGMAEYGRLVQRLVFGDSVPAENLATAQTPGGTGAVRVAADFLHKINPSARMWCSQPTWANHPNIFQAAGMAVETYPYLDRQGRALDFEGMIACLKTARPGDAVCLHACCHNPTGIDPSPSQWREIAHVLRDGQLIPVVDFAYQGFGEGIVEDTAGLRELTRAGLEMLVCTSYSKNFGLYGERVGALTVVAQSADAASASLSQIKTLIRTNYSNPPKHGAALVAIILKDPDLTEYWEREVWMMRDRIQSVRQKFVRTLQEKGVSQDFSFLCDQRGMFSFSGLTAMQVDELRNKYSIYIVGSGRINVAGITSANMDRLCSAIAAVLRS